MGSLAELYFSCCNCTLFYLENNVYEDPPNVKVAADLLGLLTGRGIEVDRLFLKQRDQNQGANMRETVSS